MWLVVLLLLAARIQASVSIQGRQLVVDGKPFLIRGICYSPVPIGETTALPPFGDYFTKEYAYIWYRDFPVIKAAGANTLRIYGWNKAQDHTLFLDVVHSFGFKLILTFYMGTSKNSPVTTAANRTAIIDDFVREVSRYAGHPSIILWSFGNELNAPWNGYTQDLSKVFNCNWSYQCYNQDRVSADCLRALECMYGHLFEWINEAARRAKAASSIPVTSCMADVDYMVGGEPRFNTDKVALFDDNLPDLSAWSLQIYRGQSFGTYFRNFQAMSDKPLIVSEYGVDAYNDACGWPENGDNKAACFNLPGDGMGGTGQEDLPSQTWCRYPAADCALPGAEAQALWDAQLTEEIMLNSPANGGAVIGGCIMAWQDEYWKGKSVEASCEKPCDNTQIEECLTVRRSDFLLNGKAQCGSKAHFTCRNWNASFHDLCGYYLYSFPDSYVNEEWFGLVEPVSCGPGFEGRELNTLNVRPVLDELQRLWSPASCFAFPACRSQNGLCCPNDDGVNASCCSASSSFTRLPTISRPTHKPSTPASPSRFASVSPTRTPAPSGSPTASPSGVSSTRGPTVEPSSAPSSVPTSSPIEATSSLSPTRSPTRVPTRNPTRAPTFMPTQFPSTTLAPSPEPTSLPSLVPSIAPTATLATTAPSLAPSIALASASPTAVGRRLLAFSPRRRLSGVPRVPSCEAMLPCWNCLMQDLPIEDCKRFCLNMSEPHVLPSPTYRPTRTSPTSASAPTMLPVSFPPTPSSPVVSPTEVAVDAANEEWRESLPNANLATVLVLLALGFLLPSCFFAARHFRARQLAKHQRYGRLGENKARSSMRLYEIN